MKEWIKGKIETYLLLKYIMVMETIKYLFGKEYLNKLLVISTITYSDIFPQDKE